MDDDLQISLVRENPGSLSPPPSLTLSCILNPHHFRIRLVTIGMLARLLLCPQWVSTGLLSALLYNHQFCSAPFCSAQFCSAQFCSALFFTAQFCSAQFWSTQSCSAQFCSAQLCSSLLSSALLSYGLLSPALLSPALPCCAPITPGHQHTPCSVYWLQRHQSVLRSRTIGRCSVTHRLCSLHEGGQVTQAP